MLGLHTAGLYTRDAVVGLIQAGKQLLLAGDEGLLAELPAGSWIGGTIPYFMAAEGGVHSTQSLFVTELPPNASVTIRRYDSEALPGLAGDHPGHGFTVLLIPAFSRVHEEFAKNVAHYPGIFDRPLVGWVSGVALDQIGSVAAKVFEGVSGAGSSDEAVALHVELFDQDTVAVDIINLFRPGTGDAISFREAGFSAAEALVNGKPINLASYLAAEAFDTRLPLVADYNGAMINVSIRAIDPVAGTVAFYAPVFAGVTYHIAAPIGDYVADFNAQLNSDDPTPAFACNCILNYVYAGLEGRSTRPITGPMTFGEIAYMLLNQTAVYLTYTRGG